jgi:hypothetical protein
MMFIGRTDTQRRRRENMSNDRPRHDNDTDSQRERTHDRDRGHQEGDSGPSQDRVNKLERPGEWPDPPKEEQE